MLNLLAESHSGVRFHVVVRVMQTNVGECGH